MQGYGTMAMEADEQFAATAQEAPTHVFVQAGVGSLAGAAVGYFANKYPDNPPVFAVVDPTRRTALPLRLRGRRKHPHCRRRYEDDNGGACVRRAEHNLVADTQGQSHGLRVIAGPRRRRRHARPRAPLPGDPRVISGESGAASLGFLYALMRGEELSPLREKLKIGKDSRVLLFSTEGATDPENYRKVVWEGACGSR